MNTPVETAPQVGILVLNYNQTEVSLKCLRSLEALTESCQIHLIDNASSDQSQFVDTIKSMGYLNQGDHHQYHLHLNSQNYGYAGGLNVVLNLWEYLDYDYYWILNNDTEVDSQSLAYILKEFQSNPQLGIVGSHLKYANGDTQTLGLAKIHPRWASSRYIKEKDELQEDSKTYVNGASFCISREVIQQVGTMSSDYFLYYEEVDYCFMAESKGFELGVALDSKVIHHEGTTTQSEGISPHLDALMIANRQKFHKKFLKNKIHALIGLFITLSLRLKRGQWKHFQEIRKACQNESYRVKIIQKLGGSLSDLSTSD